MFMVLTFNIECTQNMTIRRYLFLSLILIKIDSYLVVKVVLYGDTVKSNTMK